MVLVVWLSLRQYIYIWNKQKPKPQASILAKNALENVRASSNSCFSWNTLHFPNISMNFVRHTFPQAICSYACTKHTRQRESNNEVGTREGRRDPTSICSRKVGVSKHFAYIHTFRRKEALRLTKTCNFTFIYLLLVHEAFKSSEYMASNGWWGNDGTDRMWKAAA